MALLMDVKIDISFKAAGSSGSFCMTMSDCEYPHKNAQVEAKDRPPQNVPHFDMQIIGAENFDLPLNCIKTI